MNININNNSAKVGASSQAHPYAKAPRPAEADASKAASDKYKPDQGPLNYQRVQQSYDKIEAPRADKVDEAKQILQDWKTPSDSDVDSIFQDLFG